MPPPLRAEGFGPLVALAYAQLAAAPAPRSPRRGTGLSHYFVQALAPPSKGACKLYCSGVQPLSQLKRTSAFG